MEKLYGKCFINKHSSLNNIEKISELHVDVNRLELHSEGQIL